MNIYDKYTTQCDDCEVTKECSRIYIGTSCVTIDLCDKCLQELNRKIVEYLAEKHL